MLDGQLVLNAETPAAAAIADKIVNVSHHAMLARFNVSQWTARKSDKRISDKAAEDAHGDPRHINAIKRLLPANALEPIEKIVSEARKYHRDNTLPWQYDGVGILYSKYYFDYTPRMRDLERRFNAAVEAFMPKYRDHIEAAKILLGDNFNEQDYPHPMEVRRKFAFVLEFNKVEMGSDFRVPDIGDEAQAEIQREIDRRANDAISGMVRAVWTQIHEHVNHMVERLNAYNERMEKPPEERGRWGVFENTLVENLRDLVERMPRLNITESDAIENMRVRLLRQLCAEDPDTLRESPLTRKDVLRKAEAILADVGEFLA